MPLVNVKIEKNEVQHFSYQFSDEKIDYLLKFINAIAGDDDKVELSLMDEIEIGMNEVKKICDGDIPRKSLTDIVNVK
jgi:hypothetical protein